jgi:hypothetical protein
MLLSGHECPKALSLLRSSQSQSPHQPAMELSEHILDFEKRSAIKSQIVTPYFSQEIKPQKLFI